MAKFYLIASFVVRGIKRLPGDLIDDAVENVPALRAAGAQLWPTTDAVVSAAAARAAVIYRNRGANEVEMTAVMQAGVEQVQEFSTSTVLGGTGAVVVQAPAQTFTVSADFGTGVGKVLQATKSAVEAVLGLGSGFLKATTGVVATAAITTADVSGSLSGDVVGTLTTTQVSAVNGASVPAAGSLTAGNVLQVSAASSLVYGALNLGGGASYVTGTLPAGNQASQSLGGDASGTTAAVTVVRLTGASSLVTVPTASLAFGTSPASTGFLQFPNASQNIVAATKSTSGNVVVMSTSSADGLLLGCDSAFANLVATAYMQATTSVTFAVNNQTFVALTGSNPAVAALYRAPNATTVVAARNAANSAEIPIAATNNANTLFLGANATLTTVAPATSVFSGGNLTLFPNGATAGTSAYTFSSSSLALGLSLATPLIVQTAQNADAATTTLTVSAQDAFATATTNVDGGALILRGGKSKTEGTTGLRKGVRLNFSSTGVTMIEATEVIVGNRITALNRGSAITSTQMPANTGDLVTFVGNALTVPTASPVSGGISYGSAGAGSWRGSGGTTTTYAPA